jgi:competence protein ComGF
MKKGNESGFTLMEALVSFSVVLIITAFLPILFQTIYTLLREEKGIHPLELEVFSHQAKMEIRTAKSVTTTGKVLTIRNGNNQSITYEKYQGNIRRRVNGTGHEIMLQKVKNVVFVQVRNGAILFITGDEEDFYEIPLHAILKDWPHE